MISRTIHIRGLVQGVGFRPFVYRIATREGIRGEVENRNDGVFIIATGDEDALDKFEKALRDEAPLASQVKELISEQSDNQDYKDFSIVKSNNISDAVTGVSPDIAVCEECRRDMFSQAHRVDYPLINCTNCGPRFSIIKDLPYDRPNTTMKSFEMCPECRKEYSDVNDRRFHAQPVSCNNCGPYYYIIGSEDQRTGIRDICLAIAETISKGMIVALKGTGGYHLICDPYNDKAIEKLRQRKGREGKPFAVMSRDMDAAKQHAVISNEEEKLLSSWRKPIVLLESKDQLSELVSASLNSIGIVLPYMPIHYLIFEELETSSILFTSANLSDEPVITDDEIAAEKLKGIADLIVAYNREIYNRVDDSLAKVMAGKAVILRRSRSYTPAAIDINCSTEGIFAAGAELVNSFAIGKGKDAILSQYIGDLKNEASMDFYRSSYKLLSKLFRFSPLATVSDYHPDYLSTHFAEELSHEMDIPLFKVQHHHAHIASCMAENMLDEKVIGLAFDGVGLGSDGNIWGGEILLADYKEFERVYHLDYVPIVGADKISEEAWRSGLAYLNKYYPDKSAIYALAKDMGISKERSALYLKGIDKGINSHYYSSAGRLFDAVAAITGVNMVSTYHAEAPMRLESVIDNTEKGFYDYSLESGIISFGPTIEQITNDRLNSVAVSRISARFHNSVANALIEAVGEVAQLSGIRKVVLSGGTFQNSYLTSSVYNALKKYNYNVYLHSTVPPNDGGLALGQMAIAARKLSTI